MIADEYFLQAYAGAAADRTDPDLSPTYADLAGLPPILIGVGADDVLLRDNLAISPNCPRQRSVSICDVYPASPHACTGHATPMAQVALDDIDNWLRNHLAARPKPKFFA